MLKLYEINVADHVIRKRGGGDLWNWFSGIDSIIRPVSEKAEILLKGGWEDCIVTGTVSAESKDMLCIQVTFPDATCISGTGYKKDFLPEGFQYRKLQDMAEEKTKNSRSGAATAAR